MAFCPCFGYAARCLKEVQALHDPHRVTSTEFGKEIGRHQDAALSQPVVVTKEGRDRTVMISAEEYRRLKCRDREVLGLDDFTGADIEAVRRAQPSPESAAFNDEVMLGA